MEKILVTYQLPQEGLKELYENFSVTYPDKPKFSKEEMFELISSYDGILAAGVGVDCALMDVGQNLKIVSGYGAGYDQIDVEGATERNIVVTNTPDAVTESTAEVAM